MNDELLNSILEALQGINEGIQVQNEQLGRLNDNISDMSSRFDLCVYEYNGRYWFSIGGHVET